MGLADLFSDVISSFGFTEAQAEAPPAEENDSNTAAADAEEQEEKPAEAEASEETTEEAAEQPEEEAQAEAEGEEAEAEEEEGEEEEEEAEEEEPEDIKPKLEEECANSSQCAPYKHHFDECVERVTRQQEEGDGKATEDCVEEFFHLQHCATQCAAPKLWKSLR
ncbi:ubiquinol-cytochrome c reductase subunit 6 [Talaromyces islandicus]|uniref:Cytochrome b-c1 complex subunit 6, mitochondrial n=1 Tax=Talaromyces islandicus TaxID=28573 RepID=A0A0U1LQB6_TALIS|nr:ubiquinol-cytochrome c reductase subunit 6 [Talaromyces islandicus]